MKFLALLRLPLDVIVINLKEKSNLKFEKFKKTIKLSVAVVGTHTHTSYKEQHEQRSRFAKTKAKQVKSMYSIKMIFYLCTNKNKFLSFV